MQPITELQKPKSRQITAQKSVKKIQNQKGEIGIVGAIMLGLLAIVAILGLSWLVQGNDFFLYKVFAPKYEQVRHDTFKNSQAYNTGMLQELRNAQLSYEKADADHKDAIGSIVLHQFADYDENRLPTDLQVFVQKLRREQMAVK